MMKGDGEGGEVGGRKERSAKAEMGGLDGEEGGEEGKKCWENSDYVNGWTQFVSGTR